MSQNTQKMTPKANGATPHNGDVPQPLIRTLTQYIKDLSFENPNAPRSLILKQAPNISININVSAELINESQFCVELTLNGKALEEENLLFMFELIYGGIFEIQGVPQEHLQPILMVECPSLLFPFARNIVAESVRQGGFPPIYMDPVDFNMLYHHNQSMMEGKTLNA
jgi:preprotein translocase subunit SecB